MLTNELFFGLNLVLKANDQKLIDEEESISTDGNSSISTCVSQLSVHSSDHSTVDFSVDSSKLQIPRLPMKRTHSKRRPYNLVLEPVAEHLNDDKQTGNDDDDDVV